MAITMRMTAFWCLPCGSRRGRYAQLYVLFSSLVSLVSLFCFFISVAHSSSSSAPLPLQDFASAPTNSTSSTKENRFVPGNLAPSASFSETAKRLLDLNTCLSDSHCWGRGRRCIAGRCWGFAGPRHFPFECGVETQCRLGPIDGHFYGEGSQGSRGLFMLRVINGALSDCGSSSSYQLEHADGERVEDADCDLNEAGQLKQTNGHVAVGDGKTFVLGEALRCTYTPGITPQSTCNVSLGVVPSDVPVGFYALCGCSSTDLGASGRPCSSNEDFSVPVGLLRITGFEAPATVDFDPDVSPASAAVAGSTLASTAGSNSTASHKNVKLGSTEATKEVAPPLEIRKGGAAVEARETIDDTEPLQILLSIEDQKKLLLPSFSCIVGLPCELPSIKGVGLVSTEHFVRAFPGVYPSCQAASEASPV